MKRIQVSVAALALGACGASPPPSSAVAKGHDCLNTSFVQGFNAVSKNTVRLDAGPGSTYDVDIEGAQCTDIDWAQRIALESTGSSWICVGDAIGQGNVYFRDPATHRRLSCYIKDVRRVSEPDKPK